MRNSYPFVLLCGPSDKATIEYCSNRSSTAGTAARGTGATPTDCCAVKLRIQTNGAMTARSQLINVNLSRLAGIGQLAERRVVCARSEIRWQAVILGYAPLGHHA